MKGVKQCGLLLALFITLGLSFVISSDVSALQYQVNSIPLFVPGFATSSPNFYSTVEGFKIVTSDDIDASEMANQYVISLDNQDGTCVAVPFGKVHLPISSSLSGNKTEIKYAFNGLDFNNFDYPSSFDSNDRCLTVNKMTSYDEGSVFRLGSGNTSLGNQLKDMLPYRFKYNSFYRTDTRGGEDGLYYSNKFDLHNIFGPQGYPDKIYSLEIPIGSGKSSISSTLTNYTPITFSGEFIIDLDDPTSDFGLGGGTSFKLETNYMTGNGGVFELSNCTWDLKKDNPDDPTSVYSLKYNCPVTLAGPEDEVESGSVYFDPSYEVPYFRLLINFDYSTSNTKFFQFIYDSSISVTNNDPTPAGDWNDPVEGSDTHSAPGSSYQQDYHDQTPDYGLSLTNMFSFGFLNPFAPIFNLFSNNNSCAQIPTIASMIHSEEIQVCPWFDSNTRNIATPVLGLASMMLVFGFAVRWLGARSGNLFEDSVNTDNYSFRSRVGGRKK